jgi:Fe-S oxidoreductase
MDKKQILEEINFCIDCMECLKVCDTYIETENELQSPNGRLKIAEKVFTNHEISEDERFGLYTCTLCSLCDKVCSQNINISKIIHNAKIKLAGTAKGPYEIHNKISQGILDKDNSVNGNPDERLDWLPSEYRETEEFDQKESDTLLFLGCMSSFKVKESASATHEILKKGNYDFKILKHEPCCGEYLYSSGKLEAAKDYFEKTYEVLKENGIKTIIVTCAGCLYAFNNVYPHYIKDWDIEVKHAVQVIYKLIEEGKLTIASKDNDQEVFYHDACRMGRKIYGMNIYEEPRSILERTGTKINELEKNRAQSPCCGAGSGIRGVDKSLCTNIGASLLEQIGDKPIISSCPLCVFNFRYVNYKNQMEKNIRYITDYLLDCID